MSITSILIAEDHHVVRAGLVTLLNAEPDLEVVCDVADPRLLPALVLQYQPDLLLLDAHMPGHHVVKTAKQLLADQPGLRILILSAYKERSIVSGLLNAGAAGYVLKDDSHASLLLALRTVAAGGRWMSPRVVDVLVASAENQTPASTLTPRETDIIKLIAEGQRNQEIADALSLSHQSVRNYVQRIYRKIGVETRVEAALYALKNGLAEVG